MAKEEVPEVPKPTLLDQIGALITRLDPLLAYIAETEKRREKIDHETLETLKAIATALAAPPAVPTPPVVVKPELAPIVRVVTIPAEPIDIKAPRRRDYISHPEGSTVSKEEPVEVKVRETLARDGEYGFIVSDEGTIKVIVNAGEAITLFKGECIYFHELNLLISKLDIKTDSETPLAYRLLVV